MEKLHITTRDKLCVNFGKPLCINIAELNMQSLNDYEQTPMSHCFLYELYMCVKSLTNWYNYTTDVWSVASCWMCKSVGKILQTVDNSTTLTVGELKIC